MATAITPWLTARARRQSFNNTAETSEIDFQLPPDGGVEIASVEFAMEQVTVGADGNGFVLASVHAETQSLESALDTEADEIVMQSEIIAQMAIDIKRTIAVGAEVLTWMTEKRWNYIHMLGAPLLLNSNLTLRVITDAATTVVNGFEAVVRYRYVKMTTADVVGAFLRRR